MMTESGLSLSPCQSPKGKKLQFIEPTLVKSKNLREGIGYLKVAMFPGMIGVKVANEISAAIQSLGEIHGLIIDLRGNVGGGAGALRLMSLLTPEKVPVGYAPGKRWAERDLTKEKVNFPRFGKIPGSKGALWPLALKYLPSLLTKSAVVLETEGLGRKPYQRNVELLVDRHTASAAEMVTIFAKENEVATIVGEKTAGRLLSATCVKVTAFGSRSRPGLITLGTAQFLKAAQLSQTFSVLSIGRLDAPALTISLERRSTPFYFGTAPVRLRSPQTVYNRR